MIQFTGGCLCGQIRYAARAEPHSVEYCHCSKCRRATGAVAVAWATFPADAVEVLSGTVARYSSSPQAERVFCSRCGTPLFFCSRASSHEIDITLGSLDEPAVLQPTCHFWAMDMVPWLLQLSHLPWCIDGEPGFDRVAPRE